MDSDHFYSRKWGERCSRIWRFCDFHDLGSQNGYHHPNSLSVNRHFWRWIRVRKSFQKKSRHLVLLFSFNAIALKSPTALSTHCLFSRSDFYRRFSRKAPIESDWSLQKRCGSSARINWGSAWGDNAAIHSTPRRTYWQLASPYNTPAKC